MANSKCKIEWHKIFSEPSRTHPALIITNYVYIEPQNRAKIGPEIFFFLFTKSKSVGTSRLSQPLHLNKTMETSRD